MVLGKFKSLTWRVSADVTAVAVWHTVLIQTHTRPMLPAQTLITLQRTGNIHQFLRQLLNMHMNVYKF